MLIFHRYVGAMRLLFSLLYTKHVLYFRSITEEIPDKFYTMVGNQFLKNSLIISGLAPRLYAHAVKGGWMLLFNDIYKFYLIRLDI